MSLLWFFTLFEMTEPFQIWFSTHCDEYGLLIAKQAKSI